MTPYDKLKHVSTGTLISELSARLSPSLYGMHKAELDALAHAIEAEKQDSEEGRNHD